MDHRIKWLIRAGSVILLGIVLLVLFGLMIQYPILVSLAGILFLVVLIVIEIYKPNR